MMKILSFWSGVLLLCAGCVTAAPKEKAITIVNAGTVSPELLEQARAFAQQQLHVRVRLKENAALADQPDFQALEKAAVAAKDTNDVTFIVVTALDSDEHLKVYPESGVAIINTRPLRTEDADQFYRRVERMVMRAAAFCFELPPTPDPFCVTRDYRSLEDLDRMGRNYSPPWQGRYAKEAASRGLEPVQ
jgi:predicted Zn-dependent protease